MDITTTCYNLREEGVPDNIVKLLEEEHAELSRLLNLTEYYDEGTDYENFLENIEEYPPVGSLDESFIPAEMYKYTKTLFDVSFDVSKLYEEDILNENSAVLKQLFYTRKIIGEQLIYFDAKEEANCSIYFIISSLKEYYYGGIFCFWNKERPDLLFIQGITKYLISSMIGIFLPEKDNILPRLNSVLDSQIEALARKLGANKIIVIPIGRQGEILEKHYGYERTEEIYIPCEVILGRENIRCCPNIYKVYIKTIPEY